MSEQDDKSKKLKKLATGWASRTFTTGRLAANLGAAAAKKMVNTALDRTPTATTPSEASIRKAEALVDKMDNLKGLMMKFGQMVSYLDGSMPEGAQRVLRKLQRESQPLDFPTIKNAVENQLGAPLDQLFEEFDQEPHAAASIGQVHKAIYQGQPVAVKVQYPGIAKTLEIDLKNLRALGIFGTVGTAMSSSEMLNELKERMLEECDYLQEAAYQRHFRQLWADDPNVVIPDIVPARCAEGVLTTHFADGIGFYDYIDNSTQAERDKVGQTIMATTFGSIFKHSVFNGDPHPGNYLFLEDGRVVFLDFGCVKTFRSEFITNWKRLAMSVLEDDQFTFRDAYAKAGFVKPGAKYDHEHQWEVMQHLYMPFKNDGFTYTHEYVKESFETLIWKNTNKYRTAMPADWLLINRLQWGLNSVLAHLGASGPWPTIYRPFIESATVEGLRPPRLQHGKE